MNNGLTYAQIRNAVDAIQRNLETIEQLCQNTDIDNSEWFSEYYPFHLNTPAEINTKVINWLNHLIDASPDSELCEVCHCITDNCACWLCVCKCTNKGTETYCDYCQGHKDTHWANPPFFRYQIRATFTTNRPLTHNEKVNLVDSLEIQLEEPHQPTTDPRNLAPTEQVTYTTSNHETHIEQQ